MKKLSLIAATLLLASSGAFAQVADTFNVTVGFTSACSVKTAAGALAFTYTAFETGPVVATPTSTVFQCTRGLSATFAFDNPGGDATGSAANAAAITGAGVVAGLRYTMSGAASKTQTGADATAAAAGTADEYTVAITGSMAGGQAGDDSLPAFQVRTLTISY
jgi:hypothetical protein